MNRFTHDQLLNLYYRHWKAEADRDLEATMATIARDPLYEFYPNGLLVSGREAVRELYRRIIERFIPEIETGEVRSISFGDQRVFSECFTRLKSQGVNDRPHAQVVTLEFTEGGLVQSERVYQDRGLGELFGDLIGSDFRSVAGVTFI